MEVHHQAQDAPRRSRVEEALREALRTRPQKRARRFGNSRGAALNFAISPNVISKSDAIAVARASPNDFQLRTVSTHILTPDEEEAVDESLGLTVCASPFNQGTNAAFQALKGVKSALEQMAKDMKALQQDKEQMANDIKALQQDKDKEQMAKDIKALEQKQDSTDEAATLYLNLAGTSPTVCAVDVLTFVTRCLDHQLRRHCKSLQEENPERLGGIVGVEGQPFQSTQGNSIQYRLLLRHVAWLSQRSKPLSEQESARLTHCKAILDHVESTFIEFVKTIGFDEEASDLAKSMRKELLGFGRGAEKVNRDMSSHRFSYLLWCELVKDLEQQELSGDFPGKRWDAFDGSKDDDLGLTMLLLQDVEKRFAAGEVGGSMPSCTRLGLYLIKHFIQLNSRETRKVVCGTLSATIPSRVGGNKDPLRLDYEPFRSS